MHFEFLSESEQSTRDWGLRFGRQIVEPMVMFLDGTLGAGKTRFVQAVAAGLQIDPESVQSPTFTLMSIHDGRLRLVHVDAYRIRTLDEVDQLGLDDWLDAGCVMLIEWASRIESALPPPDIRLSIEHVGATSRRLRFNASSNRGISLLTSVNNDSM